MLPPSSTLLLPNEGRDCSQRAKTVPKIDAATEQKIGESMQAGMQEAMMTIGAAQQGWRVSPN